MQRLGKPIVHGDDELEGVCGHDGEGVSLGGADGGDPEEAVLARGRSKGRLCKGHSSAAIGERHKSDGVVGAVDNDANETNNTFQEPYPTSDGRSVENLLARLRLMNTSRDDGDNPESHMDVVEKFVPPRAKNCAGDGEN